MMRTSEYALIESVFGAQVDLLFSFNRSFVYFRAINKEIPDLVNGKNFWLHTQNNNLKNAIIDWCSVFGVDSSEPHWKKTSSDERYIDRVRALFLEKANENNVNWPSYQKTMCDFRNQYTAHRIVAKYPPVPELDFAYVIASTYFNYLVSIIPWSEPQDTYEESRTKFQLEIDGALKEAAVL